MDICSSNTRNCALMTSWDDGRPRGVFAPKKQKQNCCRQNSRHQRGSRIQHLVRTLNRAVTAATAGAFSLAARAPWRTCLSDEQRGSLRQVQQYSGGTLFSIVISTTSIAHDECRDFEHAASRVGQYAASASLGITVREWRLKTPRPLYA